MTEGQAVLTLQVLALVAAWAWAGGSDRIVTALGVTFALSAVFGEVLHGLDRQVALSLLDAAMVYVASVCWIKHFDLRGWWVGFIGMGKIALRLWHSADPVLDHWTFAAVLNATFIAQIIIAGGMADGLGQRIADHLRGAGPFRARLLRNVEGR